MNATAYAAKLPDGRTLIAVINKDVNRGLGIDRPKWRLIETLTAPRVTSTMAKLGPGANPRATTVPTASAAIFESRA